MYTVAEMGIGLNPKCSFMGVMLEDEGVDGFVHIGIGNQCYSGSIIKAATHYDLIMKNGTIDVDGLIILQNGKIMI